MKIFLYNGIFSKIFDQTDPLSTGSRASETVKAIENLVTTRISLFECFNSNCNKVPVSNKESEKVLF